MALLGPSTRARSATRRAQLIDGIDTVQEKQQKRRKAELASTLVAEEKGRMVAIGSFCRS